MQVRIEIEATSINQSIFICHNKQVQHNSS